jgi:hypothetical protein
MGSWDAISQIAAQYGSSPMQAAQNVSLCFQIFQLIIAPSIAAM